MERNEPIEGGVIMRKETRNSRKTFRRSMAVVLIGVAALASSAAAENYPPVANAGPDQTVCVGDVTQLHGTATDPNGSPIVAWQWEVISAPADSTFLLSNPTFDETSFWADTLGNYLITLIAFDGLAWSEPDAVVVTVVANEPPTAVVSASPVSGPAPLTVQFDGTASTDPEGGPLSYTWIFGDSYNGAGPTPTHEYLYPGTFLARLKVTDDHGNIDYDTVEITVTAPTTQPPVVDGGENQTMYPGQTITLQGTAFDPDGGTIELWSWQVVQGPTGHDGSLSLEHSPTSYFTASVLGQYTVSVYVIDSQFEYSTADFVLIDVVENFPPTAALTASATEGPAPLTVDFDASGSSDPNGGALSFDWNFGDGDFGVGEFVQHTFQSEGIYWVQLLVTDDGLLQAIDVAVITVTPRGNVQVSPETYDFGDVELGSLSSAIITITNPLGGSYEDPLSLVDISLLPGGSGGFAVTANPVGQIVLPGESVDVGVAFAPSAVGDATAVLRISSDDPVFPEIDVPLGGAGVYEELPPDEQVAAVLTFIEVSVDEGILAGDGPGQSADSRLTALENMIEAAGDLIQDGSQEEACDQLSAALLKCDGEPNPPDFVTGAAAPVTHTLIEVLRAALGCE